MVAMKWLERNIKGELMSTISAVALGQLIEKTKEKENDNK